MKTTQKFRKNLPLFALCLLALLSGMLCEKEFPPGTPEIDKLPKITQTGANTFGCLVDGKAFYPRGNPLGGPILQCNYQYLSDETYEGYYFLLGASDQKTYPDAIHTIKLNANKVELESKVYILDQYNTDGKLSGIFTIFSDGKVDEHATNLIHKGELSITRFDYDNQIISGTFWFDAVNADGKKVEVREGRFDVKFTI